MYGYQFEEEAAPPPRPPPPSKDDDRTPLMASRPTSSGPSYLARKSTSYQGSAASVPPPVPARDDAAKADMLARRAKELDERERQLNLREKNAKELEEKIANIPYINEVVVRASKSDFGEDLFLSAEVYIEEEGHNEKGVLADIRKKGDEKPEYQNCQHRVFYCGKHPREEPFFRFFCEFVFAELYLPRLDFRVRQSVCARTEFYKNELGAFGVIIH